MSDSNPGAFTLGAFALVVILGGTNFLAVRVSNQELAPFWGAGFRFGLAAVIFVAIVLFLRLPWPRGRLLFDTVVYGLFSFAVFYALMYWALVRVTGAMAAVILALVPLLAPMLAAAQRIERIERRILIGALVALGGIVVTTVGASGVVLPTAGLIAMILAALAGGQSLILSKRVSANHPAMSNAIGMLAGAAALLVISAAVGESWALPTRASVIVSITYLIILGSVGLFILTLLVIRHWTVAATSYIFVLMPVATMVLEWWLLDEPLTSRGVAGAILVMAGVWFGAFSRSAPRSRAAEPATAETR
ncbi:MAG TPA: EamA family transporter [Acidimicrobiia bacterium]|nr:EamA family transporter [Acidimicrobiia bacterium]